MPNLYFINANLCGMPFLLCIITLGRLEFSYYNIHITSMSNMHYTVLTTGYEIVELFFYLIKQFLDFMLSIGQRLMLHYFHHGPTNSSKLTIRTQLQKYFYNWGNCSEQKLQHLQVKKNNMAKRTMQQRIWIFWYQHIHVQTKCQPFFFKSE